MVYRTAYNPTDGPVVIDADGRQLEGRTWGPIETTDERAAAALEDGRLVQVTRPKGDDLAPGAAAAFDATDELEAARKAGDPEAVAETADELEATPTKRARRAATDKGESTR